MRLDEELHDERLDEELHDERLDEQMREEMSERRPRPPVNPKQIMTKWLHDNDISGNHLLDDGELPDKEELDLIIACIGRNPKQVKRICAAICEYLTCTYEGVVESSAAYRYDKKMKENNGIVFVLLKKDDSEIKCQKYRTYERVNKISSLSEDDNRRISEFERNHSLPSDQLEKLMTCVQRQSSSLLKHHSNLNMVSASWCRYQGSRTNTVLLCIPCIALYVTIKGLIPLDEEPFETTICDYSVDVREGVFIPFCGPYDRHKHLKMGCAITGGCLTGTLGAFVRLDNDDNKFAITSAHVVLDHSNLKQVMNDTNVNYRETNHAVFHPVQAPMNSFGHIVSATHTQGVNGQSGMEIAVIQMNRDRWPLDGSFPDAPNHLEKGFDHIIPFNFKSGKCCDISDLRHSLIVCKYGSTTKLTEGKVRVYGSAVRTGILAEKILDVTLILNNQIEIESLGNECFAEPGDSGALVLTHTKEGLVAVGIFEGIFNNVFIVTPMKAILEHLSSKKRLCQLLSFDHLSCASATDADMTEQIEETENPQREEIFTASAPSLKEIDKPLQTKISG